MHNIIFCAHTPRAAGYPPGEYHSSWYFPLGFKVSFCMPDHTYHLYNASCERRRESSECRYVEMYRSENSSIATCTAIQSKAKTLICCLVELSAVLATCMMCTKTGLDNLDISESIDQE